MRAEVTVDGPGGAAAAPTAGRRIGKLLIVGLGSIGRRHARVAHLVRPSLRIAAWRHAAGGGDLPADVEQAVLSLEDALAFGPDVAVVASPATHHLQAALALAEAGVHLLIEKPIASTAAGVDGLVALCERRGIALMTGYNLRFLPSLIRFRELLHAGTVGSVLSARSEVGQYLPGWRPDSDYRATVSARAELGGGVLLELSHEFDYLRWIFGDATWVQAAIATASTLDIDVEDTAHIILGFAPSPLGRSVTATLTMDFVRHDSTRSCTVIGSEGTLRWNALTGSIDLFRAGGTSWDVVFDAPSQRDATYVAEWESFLHAVEHGQPVAVTGSDGLQAVRLVDATRHAAATGSRVPLVPLAGVEVTG